MSENAKRIYALLDGLVPIYQLLDQPPLTTSERKARCAILCEQASDLVHHTAKALGAPGDLFADYTVDPVALEEAQDEADALNELRANLIILARLAMDAHLTSQSDALEVALGVLKRVRTEDALPFKHDPLRPFRAVAIASTEDCYSPKRKPTSR